MDALLDHIRAYTAAGERDRYLFLTGRGGHPKRSHFVRDVVKPAQRRAALADQRITPDHCLA